MGTARTYDQIGTGYADRRAAEPRIEAAVFAVLGSGRLLNVGAGTGSYEPKDRPVVAVEPSVTMIRQRPFASAPTVQATAESLPFDDNSFDAVMAILTLHHWTSQRDGLAELCRVAPRRVVLTFDPEVNRTLWLMDYLPEIADIDGRRAPQISEVVEAIGGTSIDVVSVPWDCRDGMMVAYWRRPEAYLDPKVHAGGSSLRQINKTALNRGLGRLEADLASGRWRSRYGHLLELRELDCGLRLVVGNSSPSEPAHSSSES